MEGIFDDLDEEAIVDNDDVLLLRTSVGDTIRVWDGMIEGPNEGLRVLGAADGTTVDTVGIVLGLAGGIAVIGTADKGKV